jgi:hypothetical protein
LIWRVSHFSWTEFLEVISNMNVSSELETNHSKKQHFSKLYNAFILSQLTHFRCCLWFFFK